MGTEYNWLAGVVRRDVLLVDGFGFLRFYVFDIGPWFALERGESAAWPYFKSLWELDAFNFFP